VKKPFIILVLLCLSLLSFSQKGVSTKKFPYQVLFSDHASVFGKEVKQYDYLTNEDLLEVEGSITLFYYTGKLFELTSGSYWTSDLVKKKPRKSPARPILNPEGKYKYVISQISRPTCRPYYGIEVIVPEDTYEMVYGRNQKVEFYWSIIEESKIDSTGIFEINFSNIYDDIISIENTKDYFYAFIPDELDSNKTDNINLDDGLLIFSISLKDQPEFNSGDFGIKLLDQEVVKSQEVNSEYEGLRNAIYYDYLNQNRKAKALYQYQIKQSNQDPRFIQLYENFLERNPELKEFLK
jgi:hypothetical protein